MWSHLYIATNNAIFFTFTLEHSFLSLCLSLNLWELPGVEEENKVEDKTKEQVYQGLKGWVLLFSTRSESWGGGRVILGDGRGDGGLFCWGPGRSRRRFGENHLRRKIIGREFRGPQFGDRSSQTWIRKTSGWLCWIPFLLRLRWKWHRKRLEIWGCVCQGRLQRRWMRKRNGSNRRNLWTLDRRWICHYGLGYELVRGEVWRFQGATCCKFPPLPEGVILLGVFNCRPRRVQTLKSLAQVARVE